MMKRKTALGAAALLSLTMVAGCGNSSSASVSFKKAWASDAGAKEACNSLTDSGKILEKWASTPESGKATLSVDRNTQDQDGAVLLCRYIYSVGSGSQRITLRVYGPGDSSYQDDLNEYTSDAHSSGDPLPVTAVNSKEGTAVMLQSVSSLKAADAQEGLTKMAKKLHA